MPVASPPLWTDPSSALVDIDNGQPFTAASLDAIASDLMVLGGFNGASGLAARSNLLVNGGFEIWQRTGTFNTNAQYSADRWYLVLAAGNTLVVTQETSTVDGASAAAAKLVQTTYTSGTAGAIQQRLEDYAQMRGRTLSMSVRVNCNVAGVQLLIADSASQTNGAASTMINAWQTITCTAVISASTTSVTVGIYLPAAATVTCYVDNAMLVIGSVPPMYVPMTPSEDFARCRRYYQVVTASARFNAVAADNIVDTPIYWTTPPAITPTVTTSGGTITNGTAAVVGITGNGARWELTSIAAGDCLAVGVSVVAEADV